MVEIRRLNGTKVEEAAAKANPDITALLEELTELNRAGKLSALIMVMHKQADPPFETVMTGTWPAGLAEAMFAIELLKADIIRRARRGED